MRDRSHKRRAEHGRYDIVQRFRFACPCGTTFRTIALVLCAMLVTGCGVRGPTIELESQAELNDAARLRAALLESPDLDAAPIRLESTDERITLRGFVETENERAGILEIARELFGQREIVDRIEVR